MDARDVAERRHADRAAGEAWLAAVANRAGVNDPRTASLDQLHDLVRAAVTEPRGSLSEEYHRRVLRAAVDVVMKDLGLSPSERWTLLQRLSERDRKTLRSASPALFFGLARDLLAVGYRERAKGFGAVAKAHGGLDGDGSEIVRRRVEEAQTMATANRRAADAIEKRKNPSVEVRESRRTTRKALNRARRDLGLHPLPVPRPLRRSACQGARHRRAPGRKPIRRPRSRSTTAPARGDPDPDGDLEPLAPAPGARRQHRGGTASDLAAHRPLSGVMSWR